NTFSIPDIPSKPCLLLCPHMTFLSLAFLRKAFAVPDLTPKRLYNLKVPAGQGQQLIPWNDEMNDTCVFRKLNRTALGVEFSDDHMPYSTLRPRLLNFGEVTGIALPGLGTGFISDAQRNLCLMHAPNSTVFQRNYLSRHITADTHSAYRGLPPQVAIMRYATGLTRTIDKRRPRHLTAAQEDQAQGHPNVQKLLQKKNELKDWMKRDGRTITSYEGTQLHDEYDKKKQAYEREYEFQKKAFLNELKKKFEKEQAVIDIQNQIHGLELKMNDLATDTDKVLLPKRLRAIDALFAFATSSPEEERSRRVRVVDMLVALGQMQDGHQYPSVLSMGKRSLERNMY
ncbi:hypothetical protein LTS18_007591, partial [Coniosporium uncinatum]